MKFDIAKLKKAFDAARGVLLTLWFIFGAQLKR